MSEFGLDDAETLVDELRCADSREVAVLEPLFVIDAYDGVDYVFRTLGRGVADRNVNRVSLVILVIDVHFFGESCHSDLHGHSVKMNIVCFSWNVVGSSFHLNCAGGSLDSSSETGFGCADNALILFIDHDIGYFKRSVLIHLNVERGAFVFSECEHSHADRKRRTVKYFRAEIAGFGICFVE